MTKIFGATLAATFALATAAFAAPDYGKNPYEVGLGGSQIQQDRNMTRADVPTFMVRDGQNLSRGLYDQN